MTTVNAVKRTLTTEDVCGRGPAGLTGFRSMQTQWSVTIDFSGSAAKTIYYAPGDATVLSTDAVVQRSPLCGRR